VAFDGAGGADLSFLGHPMTVKMKEEECSNSHDLQGVPNVPRTKNQKWGGFNLKMPATDG
jgi:hypothetical protein